MKKSKKVRVGILSLLLLVLVGTVVNAERFNMSYLYGNFNYITLINNTKGSLNEVSPSYFDLTVTGNLKLNTVDASLVRNVHNQGMKIVPFLSNHWDRETGRAALENRYALADQIVEAVKRYDLDGVNVDIENVTHVDRDNYTDFVRILREKMPADKVIAVAVAANPNNWQTGWHGSYDYTNLAKYADYLMIMTYDEHYEGGDAGPVASINFVERSIQYALSKTDKSKIVVGIPFFGRYWKQGTAYGGYGVSLTKITSMMSQYSSAIEYDVAAKSPKVTIVIKENDRKPVINGKTLTAGTYTFWYENDDSIKAKLALVNQYDLYGTGSWSLGQENNSIWNFYKEELNKGVRVAGPFDDVPGDKWSAEAIEKVKENGYMKGKENGIFEPESGLTRAEFATILSRVLKLEDSEVVKYSDLRNHWASKDILLVTKKGLMDGYPDNTFRPDHFITREEVAKVISLLNMKGFENVEGRYFKDITKNTWSYEYIIDVTQKGFMNGYSDHTFRPQNIITREEMAVMVARIFL